MPFMISDSSKNFDVQSFLMEDNLTVDEIFVKYPVAAALFINYYRVQSDPSLVADWKAYHDSYLIMVQALKKNWDQIAIQDRPFMFHLVDRKLAKSYFYRSHYQAPGFSLDLCPISYESKFDDILKKFLTASATEQAKNFNFIFKYFKNSSLILKAEVAASSLDLLIKSFKLDNQDQWPLLLKLLYAVPSLDVSVQRNQFFMKHMETLNLDEKTKFQLIQMQHQACYELMTESVSTLNSKDKEESEKESEDCRKHILKLYLDAADKSSNAEKEIKQTLKDYLFKHHQFWDGWHSMSFFKKIGIFVGGLFLFRGLLYLLSLGLDLMIAYLWKMSIGAGFSSLFWGALKLGALLICGGLKLIVSCLGAPIVFGVLTLGLAYYSFFHSKISFYKYFFQKGQSLYEKISEIIDKKFTTSFFQKTNSFSDFQKNLDKEIKEPLKKHSHHHNQEPTETLRFLFNKIKCPNLFKEIQASFENQKDLLSHLKKGQA